MTTTPDVYDPEARAAAASLLLAEATTAQERNAVTRVLLRAGFLWRCHPCHVEQYVTTERCGCGAERPADLAL